MNKITFRLVLLTSFSFCDLISLENVDCGSYVDYVNTDNEGHFRYKPRVVKLNRCRGVDDLLDSPQKFICTPSTNGVKKLDLDVINMETFEQKLIVMENYTECEMRCNLTSESCNAYQTFKSDTCECSCNYNAYPKCPPNKVWSNTDCNCICSPFQRNCHSGSQFNENECRCKCIATTCPYPNQIVDELSCNCVNNPKAANRKVSLQCKNDFIKVIVALIIEGFSFALLFALFYIFYYKPKLDATKKQAEAFQNSVHAYCNGLHATDL